MRNKFNKSRTKVDWQKHKKQRNECVKALNHANRQYFNNLTPKVLGTLKKFWMTDKLLISNKSKTANNIILSDNQSTMKDNKNMSHNLSKYFMYWLKL